MGVEGRASLGEAATVYFGGGTPSLLKPQQIHSVLEVADQTFGLAADAEITLEANPGTLDAAYLAEILSAGVNRLSLGAQSFDPAELSLLRRMHSAEEIDCSMAEARLAGFDNISLDLIFGLPGQTLKGWEANLSKAISLQPEHISLYALTIETETPLERMIAKGILPQPDEDLLADMFEFAMESLARAGYEHYEISNWAVSARFESRHNKVYWWNSPYLGIGAGAHGCLGGYRLANVATIPAYLQAMKDPKPALEFPFSPATAERLPLDLKTIQQETVMLGLRLTREGVSSPAFRNRFGIELEQTFASELKRISDKGLGEWADFPDGKHYRLTNRGIMLGNQAFMEFV